MHVSTCGAYRLLCAMAIDFRKQDWVLCDFFPSSAPAVRFISHDVLGKSDKVVMLTTKERIRPGSSQQFGTVLQRFGGTLHRAELAFLGNPDFLLQPCRRQKSLVSHDCTPLPYAGNANVIAFNHAAILRRNYDDPKGLARVGSSPQTFAGAGGLVEAAGESRSELTKIKAFRSARSQGATLEVAPSAAWASQMEETTADLLDRAERALKEAKALRRENELLVATARRLAGLGELEVVRNKIYGPATDLVAEQRGASMEETGHAGPNPSTDRQGIEN